MAASLVAHAAMLAVLMNAPAQDSLEEPPVMTVALFEPEPPPPAPVPAPEEPAAASPAPPRPPPLSPVRPPPVPRPPQPEALPPAEKPTPQISDAQVAGAMRVGSGSGSGGGEGAGGGRCDMARLLQDALRGDRMVLAAVAQARASGATSRNIMMWDGDWVRTQGEEGKGLAAVRQAIMWKIAFSPPACKNERVRGLVLLTLNEGPGGARIVVGAGQWRWADLLT